MSQNSGEQTSASVATSSGEAPQVRVSDATDPWDFPGGGTAEHIEDLSRNAASGGEESLPPPRKLGVWEATAICGNDITSSVLCVAALAALAAGPYAPLALLGVAVVLFLFRGIYYVHRHTRRPFPTPAGGTGRRSPYYVTVSELAGK
jgi:hypothetical protein